jgi:hypothetical protein
VFKQKANRVEAEGIMPREKRVVAKLRRTVTEETPKDLPPNEQLERYADEAYGDTDVPARQRDDSANMKETKKTRAGHSQGRHR